MNDLNAIIVATITAFGTAFGTALGAIAGKFFEKQRKKKSGVKFKGKSISFWLAIGAFLGAVIGLIIGLYLGWDRQPQDKILWDFTQGTEGWYYKPDAQDSSSDVSWDADKKALRAEFDFGQIDPSDLLSGEEPRATFIIDNLDDDWTSYNNLVLDVTNLNPQLLEISFSIYINNCYYEFGGYKNVLPQQIRETISFKLADPQYKTCKLSDAFENPAVPFEKVRRFDIILGINLAPADWDRAKGAILIDNIKLQK